MEEYKIIDHPDEPYPVLMQGERHVAWCPNGDIDVNDILPELNRLARENDALRKGRDAKDAERLAWGLTEAHKLGHRPYIKFSLEESAYTLYSPEFYEARVERCAVASWPESAPIPAEARDIIDAAREKVT